MIKRLTIASAVMVLCAALAAVAWGQKPVFYDGTNYSTRAGATTGNLDILQSAGLTTNQPVLVVGAVTNWLSFTNGILYDVLETAP